MKEFCLPPEARKVRIVIMLSELSALEPTPSMLTKQVEFHDEWKPLLPKIIFPEPSNEIIEFAKEQIKEKNRTKAQNKKRIEV